jgi:hypothetical protein
VAPLQAAPDAIAVALDDAADAWRRDGDRRAIRRALVRLLVELDGE